MQDNSYPINGYLYNEGYTADRAKLIVLSAMWDIKNTISKR